MIRAAKLVQNEIPEVQFKVYGSLEVDKEYVKKCQNLVKKLKLVDTFHFEGFHNQPSMIFNEGDISILTSISEGFPYTVIESMSCGRPVVATDVGGIRDALEGCGILCKPRDPRDIANGVVKLLQDTDLRLEYGRKARDRVATDLYHRAIGRCLLPFVCTACRKRTRAMEKKSSDGFRT